MPLLTEISDFLDIYVDIHQYPQEKHGIWKPAIDAVRKMGLVLEPWPELYTWILEQNLDAVFVHRPWKVDMAQLPAHTGILSYHLPFDEKLTLGYNPMLAAQLGIPAIKPIGNKEGRPLGMSGICSPISFQLFSARIEDLFGPPEQRYIGKATEISSIAVANAMTENLVLEAVSAGAQLYLTGQFRKPAASVVAQTGIHVIATGHRQSEIFGLHLLAKILTEKWPYLQIYVASELEYK